MKAISLSLIIILTLLIQTESAIAGSCDTPDIHKLTRPIDPSNPNKGTFEYRYRLIRAHDSKSSTVVIYLHGGPGIPSIGLAGPKIGNISLIQTDIRGVGCNHLSPSNLPDMAFRSDWIASDVVALIQDAGLKDYVLYGLSYGTLLATEVADLISKTPHLPLPKAVVLEGTLGKYFGLGENMRESSKQWEEIKRHLDPLVVQELSGESPVEVDGDTWGSYISTYLDLGSAGSFRTSFLQYLSFANPHAHYELKDELKQTLKSYENTPSPLGMERAFRLIVCREIADDLSGATSHPKLQHGNLVPSTPHFCGDIKMSSPFDSKRYTLQSDLYYFQGDQDSSTPLESAEYSFENQNSSPHKVFVKIKGAGHFPLSRDLGDCKEQLWDQIAHQNRDGVIKTLSTCKLHPALDVKQVNGPDSLSRHISNVQPKIK